MATPSIEPPTTEPLMDINHAEDEDITGINHEAKTNEYSGYCARFVSWIFETGPIKTKVLLISTLMSFIVILVLFSVIAHEKLDNSSPCSMPYNTDKGLLKFPCQVVNQAQYPPVQKTNDDTCFYTRENIMNILNVTRKSTYKMIEVLSVALSGVYEKRLPDSRNSSYLIIPRFLAFVILQHLELALDGYQNKKLCLREVFIIW